MKLAPKSSWKLQCCMQ